MAEDLKITATTKSEKYEQLFPQIRSLIEGEEDVTANLANISAALKTAFDFLWVGFYLVKEDELVLGPFQGPVACTRIRKGKGVCGSAWSQKKNIIVPDVDAFPGHIACSSMSKSEIVLPLFSKTGDVVAVLDVDSENLDFFDKTDELHLSSIVQLISLSNE